MDVMALAALAGNTLVAAAVTDAWENARHKIARLFGRGTPDAHTERRLEATRTALTALPGKDLEQARRAEAMAWQTRFADLLADYPDAEDELEKLVKEIQARIPATAVSASDHSAVAGRDIMNTASTGGVAAQAIPWGCAYGAPPGRARRDPGDRVRARTVRARCRGLYRDADRGVSPNAPG